MIKSIAVFCGSSEGYDESYREAAYGLGAFLAESKIRVVYGGAKVGLMGSVAEGVLANNGTIIGVIPGFLKTTEVAHEGLTELIMVDTMQQRKMKMHELSDGVITLPGGWGTMDELFEMLTWGQLGLHQKPVGLLNINGFYDSLKVLVDNMVQEGFLNEWTRDMLLVAHSAQELLEQMQKYEAPEVVRLLRKQAI
jgi:uncharacterized protein (TIGR00730 family)